MGPTLAAGGGGDSMCGQSCTTVVATTSQTLKAASQTVTMPLGMRSEVSSLTMGQQLGASLATFSYSRYLMLGRAHRLKRDGLRGRAGRGGAMPLCHDWLHIPHTPPT